MPINFIIIIYLLSINYYNFIHHFFHQIPLLIALLNLHSLPLPLLHFYFLFFYFLPLILVNIETVNIDIIFIIL